MILRIILNSLIILASVGYAHAELDENQVRSVVKQLETDVEINHSHSICPGEHYGDAQGLLYGWGWRKPLARNMCRNDLPNCLKACQDGSGRACWVLATIMATSEIKGADEAGDKLHAHACHAGYHSGCTNRGGGIRDFLIKDTDPLTRWTTQQRQACSFKMFQRGCNLKQGGWGCVMLGDAYSAGDGTPVSPRLAMRSYEKAITSLCRSTSADGEGNAMENINQGCVRARNGLERMKALREQNKNASQNGEQDG